MILYYAVGGGLGHLVRARRVLEVLGLTERAAIVTASPYARDPRITGGIPVIEVPPELEHEPEEHRAWVRTLDAERMIVDTFPGGIQGELCDAQWPLDCVARVVRWDAYRRAVPHALPVFDTTYIVEELTPEHDAFVREHSRNIVPLDLTTTHAPEPVQDFWLIVHSGPEEEVRELVAYTIELLALETDPPSRVLVATRCELALPPHFEHTDVYPAARLFPSAKRIVSAAGFNVMSETKPFREKHSILPFARRYDDQYFRAKMAACVPSDSSSRWR